MAENIEQDPCPICGWDNNAEPESHLYLKPGNMLNNQYLIGRVLGHGGFGITYLALDTKLKIKLAIKEYLPREYASRDSSDTTVSVHSGSAKEEFAYGLEKFLEEAQNVARFQGHPGIVGVLNFFEANGTGYMVMPYVEGTTLKEYLQSQPERKIPFDKAMNIFMPVLDALREVHKAGMLHRDISPDNIYITTEGQVKLLDFGAARFAMGEHSKSLSIVLKPGYSPKEQYSSKGKQGPWTDVYAVAASLYRAITGIVPDDALDRAEEDELKLPTELGIDIPELSQEALLAALSINAKDRIQTIEAVQESLIQIEVPKTPPVEDTSCESEREITNKLAEPVTDSPVEQTPTKSEKPNRENNTTNLKVTVTDVPKKSKTLLLASVVIVVLVVTGIARYLIDYNEQQEREQKKMAAEQLRLENERIARETAQQERKAKEKAEREQREAEQLRLEEEHVTKQRLYSDKSFKINDISFTMKTIRGGSFNMGCIQGDSMCGRNETPRHNVTIQPFRMLEHEVSKEMFAAFVHETEYKTDVQTEGNIFDGCIGISGTPSRPWKSGTSWQSHGFEQTENHPVVCVTYNDAQAFIKWLNDYSSGTFRLPTEAEWEYAARAGSVQIYPWGNDVDNHCDYANGTDKSAKKIGVKHWKYSKCDDGYAYTAPSGALKANSFGLYSMDGNVSEWVHDCVNNSYKNAPVDGSAWLKGNCGKRVLRGGSWFYDNNSLRSSSRRDSGANVGYDYVGFRLASDL